MDGREMTHMQRLAAIQRAEDAMDEKTRRRYEIARQAKVELGLARPEATKGVDLTGVYVSEHGDLAWRSHPSGLLVHGPGASEIIDKARGQGQAGSALWAVLSSYITAYREPQIHHYRGEWMQPDMSEAIKTGPLAKLLRRPHPRLTMNAIKVVLRWSLLWRGRAYLVKRRTGSGTIETNTTGAVAELWPLDVMRVKPKVYAQGDPRRASSNGWIDYYAYEIGGGHVLQLPPENVIEFTLIPDPRDPRSALQPIAQILEDLATDAELTALSRAVITNLGIPGIVVSPKMLSGGGGDTIPKADRDQMRDSINARTTGAKRGSTIVLSKPVDFNQFQSNLEILKLDQLWRQVETRISGAIGWPAVLAGLGVGLNDANRATIDGLKEHATESVLMPAWVADGEAFTMGLERDFALGEDEWIGFAWDTVRALQQDENDQWKRVGEAWGRNELTIGQHHHLLGLELPAGVDPALRKADIEGAAQLSGLLGPALGKALADRLVAKGMGGVLPLPARALPDFTKAASSVSATVSADDVDRAVDDWDTWAKANAPQYVGMLDPDVEGEEPDEEGDEE